MKSLKRFWKTGALALCVVALAWRIAFAAADYVGTGVGKPWQVITVTTAAVVNVTLTSDDYTIVHLGIQNDGSTASVSTDKVFVMRNQDETGAAVTMAANLNDGIKLPLLSGSSATFSGFDVPTGADGKYEIQLKAVGNGAKVLIIRGRAPL